ncbi:MAG: tetratricopeptide repeat protein [Desertifilum sp.]|nr:tetratricopeptide repeat protein [Desertifilum sp.]
MKFNDRRRLLFNATLLLSLILSPPLARAAETETVFPRISQTLRLAQTPEVSEADRAFERGIEQLQQGELRDAIPSLETAFKLYNAVGNAGQAALSLSGLGLIYNSLGELQPALKAYEQALPLYRSAGDRIGVADTLNQMGLLYNALGNRQQALAAYEEALPLYQEAEDRGGEAYTLNNMGVVYSALGEYQRALDVYKQALPLWREVEDRQGEATSLNNIGVLYDSLGDFNQALESYNQALPLYQAIEDIAGVARTLNNIGLFYDALGDYQKALESYQQALALWREVGDARGEASTLNNIGYVYANSAEFQQALTTYNQALTLWQQASDIGGEASTLNNMGYVYANSGDLVKAIAYYNQALPLRRAVGDRAKEALTLFRIAQVQRQQGEFEPALAQIESALTIIEDLRTKVSSQELRTSFFASKQDYYEFYIDLLMQLHQQNPDLGYDAKALQASERARARSLLEILTEANAEIRSGIDPQLLAQQQQLQQQLGALEETRIQLLSSQQNSEQAAQINQKIEQLETQYATLQANIRQISPRYAALTQPQPLTLAEIQQQVLDSETVLLEYSLGQERSYLWVVTPTEISSYESPPRAEIEQVALEFRNLLTIPSLRIRRYRTQQVAKALSDLLLAPVAHKLGDKRLLVVSDGALQYIPFAALATPGTGNNDEDAIPLIVNHELVSLPSASTLGVLRRELAGRTPATKALAVLADPVFGLNDERVNLSTHHARDKNLEPFPTEQSQQAWKRLPFTRQEAEKILALVPKSQSRRAFGFAASRDAATSPQLGEYRIVHFATHGILDSQNPEQSGLILSLVDEGGQPADGFLRLPEIFNLNLPAELIVLSACETGLGQEIRGEGLVGLTRGFMYAGAARIVVSLWSVDDEATASLMVDFYQRMLQSGLTPAAALRQAQIAMWEQQQWNAPYYWAGFTLQGEWQP